MRFYADLIGDFAADSVADSVADFIADLWKLYILSMLALKGLCVSVTAQK
jgi:hypothetical protein